MKWVLNEQKNSRGKIKKRKRKTFRPPCTHQAATTTLWSLDRFERRILKEAEKHIIEMTEL